MDSNHMINSLMDNNHMDNNLICNKTLICNINKEFLYRILQCKQLNPMDNLWVNPLEDSQWGNLIPINKCKGVW